MYPKTDRGWAGLCARLFKNIRPYAEGGNGLSGNRRFEAAFEGGFHDAPATAENVLVHLREMVRTDRELAYWVVRHSELDGTGVADLIEIARRTLTRQPSERELASWRTIGRPTRGD